jgi:mannose-6-phosphate isomerase-like protein (cupin superfamily)
MLEYVGPLEKETLDNTYFRQVLFTAKHSQLVLMCLAPGEEIGDEVHPNVDQFFRIEQGEARFVLNEKQEHVARDGDAVVVPAGTYHNVINSSKTAPLKLYTIYSPPNHPAGTVHKTKAEAEAAEAAEHDATGLAVGVHTP